MAVVTVSPKFQVVVSRHICESLGLYPGQKLGVIQYEGRVEFVPILPARKARGFLKGIATDIRRDTDCL